MNVRKRVAVVLPAACALVVGMGVGSASAVAGPDANCYGREASGINAIGELSGQHGQGGREIATFAMGGGVGEDARTC